MLKALARAFLKDCRASAANLSRAAGLVHTTSVLAGVGMPHTLFSSAVDKLEVVDKDRNLMSLTRFSCDLDVVLKDRVLTVVVRGGKL